MGVMPAASNHTIPPVFHSLMTDEDSDIIDFYPEDFTIDLNGKKMEWQGVALLPFIDEKRLLDAMATRYPQLNAEEVARNEHGNDALLFSTKHPLYDEVVMHFYSKKAGAPKYGLNPKLSEGLTGKIEKNDGYLPSSSLVFPLPNGGMPDLDEDLSMNVNYVMPVSTHVHKSMLLPGVTMPRVVLDSQDIADTRAQTQRTGRNFGGAPLRDHNGGGGRINYGSDNRNGQNGYGNGHGNRNGNDHGNSRGYGNSNGRGGGGRGGHGGHGSHGGPPGGYNAPLDLSQLPPALQAQAAQHGFVPPPFPPLQGGQMPPFPPPPHGNGYGGGQSGHGGGHGGHGGYRR